MTGGWRTGRAVVSAERVKLTRPGTVLASALPVTLTVVVSAAAAGLLPRVPDGALADGGTGAAGFPLSLADLSSAEGAVGLVRALSPQLALVALCFFAASFGSELRTGMLRSLRARQASSAALASGKLVALAAWWAGTTLLVHVAGLVTTAGVLASRGAAPDAWWSLDALGAAARSCAGMWAAGVVYGLLGAVAALALGSTALAVGAGLAWVLAVDPVLVTLGVSGTPGTLARQMAWGAGSDVLPGALAGTAAATVGALVLTALLGALPWLVTRRAATL